MHLVTRKAAIGFSLSSVLRRRPLQSPQRVKTSEFEAAIVAQQLMQSGQLKHKGRIFVSALDTRTFAAGTPHTGLRSLVFLKLNYEEELQGPTIVANDKKARQTFRLTGFWFIEISNSRFEIPEIIPAASYSPTQLPAQYHRLQEA